MSTSARLAHPLKPIVQRPLDNWFRGLQFQDKSEKLPTATAMRELSLGAVKKLAGSSAPRRSRCRSVQQTVAPYVDDWQPVVRCLEQGSSDELPAAAG